jgi:flagellar biosynthesis protein FlhG
VSAATEEKARVIALAGGKGGVGTTLLAANVAIHLARQGREVILADVAPEGAAAHAQVGLPLPSRHLGERLAAESIPLADLIVTGGIPNLKLLAGIPDCPASPPRPDEFAGDVLEEAARLPCDYVIADAGSGRSRAVRLACRAADTLLLVSTPEPLSLRGVLRLQASVLYGALEEALGPDEARSHEELFGNEGLRGLLGTLRGDKKRFEAVLQAVRRRQFGLVLNQVRTGAENQAATRVGAVLSMLQAVIIDPVITLEYDLSALQAVWEGRVLSQRFPNSLFSRSVEKLAVTILAPTISERRPGGDRYAPVDTWHHYRLLALDPKAAPRDVQRHYEWIRAPFQAGGEAEAVAERTHLDRILARVETAYRTLMFLENRREYDRELVAKGILEAADLRELEAGGAATGEDQAAGATVGEAAEAASPEMETAAREATSRGRQEKGRKPKTGQRQAAAVPESEVSEIDREPDTEPEPAGPISDEIMTEEEMAKVLAPGGRYSGAALRAFRQRRRLEVTRIAEITKIRVHQIQAIEDERYPDLPVPVFLRGFLRAYALCLDLDPDEVVQDYMDAYEAWSRMQV